jgi:hypothetical protein
LLCCGSRRKNGSCTHMAVMFYGWKIKYLLIFGGKIAHLNEARRALGQFLVRCELAPIATRCRVPSVARPAPHCR